MPPRQGVCVADVLTGPRDVLCCAVLLQWHAGDNVGTGDDYTIFSKVEGIVIYSKRPGRNLVSGRQNPC